MSGEYSHCTVLISLLSACKKDDNNDDTTNLALLLALSGGSTCTVTAGGATLPVASVSPAKLTVASIFFTTASGLGLGAIQLSNVVANDFGSFTVNSGTISNLTIYKGTCPLTLTSATAVLNTDYMITSGGLTNIAAATNIKFLTPGSYVILAQTANNAQATVQYGQLKLIDISLFICLFLLSKSPVFTGLFDFLCVIYNIRTCLFA